MKRALAALLLVLGGAAAAQTRPPAPPAAQIEPPRAPRHPHPTRLHGETRQDDYFWLRQRRSPAVLAYLRAENAYTDAQMAPTRGLQETLYRQMLSHVQENFSSPPYPDGDWLYSVREGKGLQYPIYQRAPRAGGAAVAILDLNQLARGHKFISLDARQVSDDGTKLAYLLDESGRRDDTLYIDDLSTHRRLPDRLHHVKDLSWSSDGRTLFYIVQDRSQRAYRLYRHALGQPQVRDALLYEEKDERFDLDLERTRSRRYLLLNSHSYTTSEVRVLPADDPGGQWRVIEPRRRGHEYYLDHGGDRFFIRTNDTARNFRIVTAPVATPDQAHWQELLPASADALIEDIDVFARFLVLSERSQALSQLRVVDLRSGAQHRIAMLEAVFEAGLDANHQFDSDVLRYRYESLTTPTTWIDYQMATRQKTTLKQLEVPGGYDASRYVAERLWAPASDGKRVPISLVRRKDVARDGKAPLLLTGYGAYGNASEVEFDPAAIPLLDRGLILATAHVRGGGDLGKPWHDDGRLMHKRNSFTDFIAASEYLLAQRYVAPGRLAISGGSAGGLLVGAVLNLRPDLYAAALALSPFVDVINTMLDESLPLTTGEFEEWGNPKERDAYHYMLGYSPYDNVRAQSYPAMLVRSAINDTLVGYWEPTKWVAKLRALKTDAHPILLKVNLEPADHSGASGRYDRLREAAFDDAFLLRQLGIND